MQKNLGRQKQIAGGSSRLPVATCLNRPGPHFTIASPPLSRSPSPQVHVSADLGT